MRKMSKYVLSCESTVDLTKSYLQQRHIAYIGYPYELNGRFYQDDFGETLSLENFYREMEQGASTKTAQINAYEFTQYFETFLSQGKDVLHICLSSGITGVLNAAQMAKNELEDKYPDRSIYLVDSLAASAGSGLLVEKLADLRDEGMDIEQLWQWVQENKLRVNNWFFSSDLKFYIRGGRISKTAGIAGTMLGICPLLDVDVKGNHATLVSDGALAGSVTNLMDCLRTAVRKMGIPLETAVACASVNPARSLGVYESRGSITPGKKADIVLLREDLSLRAVIKDGKVL